MAAKTYIPTLLVLCTLVVRYARRWQQPLSANLGPGQPELLESLLTAAEALIDAITTVKAM